MRPDCVDTGIIPNPHFFYYKIGFSVDENQKRVTGPFNTVTVNMVQINHYYTRSYQDFVEVKLLKWRADMANWGRDMGYFKSLDRNEVFDNGISERFGKRLFGDDKQYV